VNTGSLGNDLESAKGDYESASNIWHHGADATDDTNDNTIVDAKKKGRQGY